MVVKEVVEAAGVLVDGCGIDGVGIAIEVDRNSLFQSPLR